MALQQHGTREQHTARSHTRPARVENGLTEAKHMLVLASSVLGEVAVYSGDP
jgi:hypothetical protein